MPAILAAFASFLLSAAVVKFVTITAIFGVLAVLVPVLVGYLGEWINTQALNSSFASFTPAVWWFVDLFQLGFGLPLLISAACTRFLIRRLPVIG